MRDPSGQVCLTQPARQGRQPPFECRRGGTGRWPRVTMPRLWRGLPTVVCQSFTRNQPTTVVPSQGSRVRAPSGQACLTQPARKGREPVEVPAQPCVDERRRRSSPLTSRASLPRTAREGMADASEAGVRGVRPRANSWAVGCPTERRGRATRAPPLRGKRGRGTPRPDTGMRARCPSPRRRREQSGADGH